MTKAQIVQRQKDEDLVTTARSQGDTVSGRQRILRLLKAGANPGYDHSNAFEWSIYYGNFAVLNAFANYKAPLPPRPFNRVNSESPNTPQLYRWLLAHGAKPDFYALQSALCSKLLPDQLLQILLEAGADANSHGWWNYVNDEEVWATPLMVAAQQAGQPSYPGPQFADGRMIKALLARGAKVNERTKDGRTALDFALLESSGVNARVLLQGGATVGKSASRLLRLSADNNEPLIIDELDKRNLFPKNLSFVELGFPTGSGVVKRLLAHGANPNAANEGGWTELHQAAADSAVESVKMLLDAGANIEAKGVNPGIAGTILKGGTPLFTADTEPELPGKTNPAQQLLLERGANPNARDANGVTPLIFAALGSDRGYGSEQAAQLLCGHGADLLAKDNKGNTALHYAVIWSLPIVQTLLRANSTPEFLEAHDLDGNTALLLAVYETPYSTGVMDEKRKMLVFPTIQALLEAGAKTEAVDNEGNTIFHFGSDDRLTFVLSAQPKSNLDVPNKQGFTPLYVACSNGREFWARYLLSHGANPDFKAKNGMTPRQVVSQPITGKSLLLGPYQKRVYLEAWGADVNLATLDLTTVAQAFKKEIETGRKRIGALLQKTSPLESKP